MTIRSNWRHAGLGLVLLLALCLFVYRQTGLAMVEIWDRSGTFAHAFVVPPISLWLIWRQRAQLALMTPRPALIFLMPMALAALAWLLGELVAVNSVTQLAFTALLVLCVPLQLGWAVARVLFFPLTFLFFCVPIGEFLMPQMMEWTADFTVLALHLSGVPVYREGLHFIIPSGSWSVVQACSGIRYLIASLMVGTLFAYLNYRSLKRRLIFVGVAFLVPVVANWMRAYMIVMLGHLSANKLATGVDHLIYGWVFFGVVILLLFMIGMRWAEPEAPLYQPAAPSGAQSGRGPILATLLGLLVLASPSLAIHQLMSPGGESVLVAKAPDLAARGWQVAAVLEAAFKPHFENPRAEQRTAYAQADGPTVGLYLAYYRHQDYGSKLISSNNVVVPVEDKHWRMNDSGVLDLTVGGYVLPWRTGQIGEAEPSGMQAGPALIAWQIYWVDGHWTRSDTLAKLYAVRSRLLGSGDDSAVLVLYANRAQGGEALLRRFVDDNFVLINAWLSGLRQPGADGAQRK